MMVAPRLRYPSSLMDSQVDFDADHDVQPEANSHACQHLQVKQLVGNGEKKDIDDKDADPESPFHCDVLGIGRRRMMENVAQGGRLVEARPVHCPAMERIFDKV